jgi:hypothetical protein
MTLLQLLDRAGVSRYQRFLWFSHCRIVGKSLLVSDKSDYGTISRCWMPVLRTAWPEVEATYSPHSAEPPAAPKPALQRAFKKSYYDGREKAEQQDMLGRS